MKLALETRMYRAAFWLAAIHRMGFFPALFIFYKLSERRIF
jgi:hypothetical protein